MECEGWRLDLCNGNGLGKSMKLSWVGLCWQAFWDGDDHDAYKVSLLSYPIS